MSLPDAQLMELYGTDEYYLEKTGAIPPGALRALQVAAPILSLGLARADAKRQQRLLAEAEAMNQMMRAVEAERMRPVHLSQGSPRGYQHSGMPQDLDMQFPNDPVMSEFEGAAGKLASAVDIGSMVGRQLAREGLEKTALDKLASGIPYDELTELEKEAFGGAMFGKALGFLGKGVGKVGKGLGGGGGLLGRTGEKMRQAGIGMRQKGLQMRGVKPKPLPTKPRGNLVDGATAQAHKPGSPYRKAPEPTATPKPVAATEAVEEVAEEGAKKKGLIGWRGKAALGLGAAGLGYAGLKGAQTARDYMMVPSHGGSRWGAYGGQVPHGVNQYGYVQQRF